MNDLRQLYQETILDHANKPRNRGLPNTANRTSVGHNPLCGDRVELALELRANRIVRIGFVGEGCAISRASASMLTEVVQDRTVEEVKALFDDFRDLVTSDVDVDLGKLAVFAGVREYPVRVKCATLPWHVLVAAISEEETVTLS